MVKKQILILENNQKNYELLNTIFSEEDFESVAVLSREDFDALQIDMYDLVIVNTHVNYIEPAKLLDLIHKEYHVKVPVIYLDNAAEHDKKMLKECFEHGASEYIKKPFDKYEILFRVRYHFTQVQKMKEYKLRVDKLAHLATVDQLSKSSSKMHMQAILKHQLNNYKRYKIDTSIIYMSLVNVDKFVGLFGFEVGEKLISVFAKELKNILRESDFLARWAGSDFIILLTNTDAQSALIAAKKINEKLSRVDIMKNTQPVMAFGITQFKESDDIGELLSRSKYALKEAKKQEYGRTLLV
jgi:diguanylate cyclase (GGDEF)-like protein